MRYCCKAYLRMLVEEIRLEGNELKIRGSYGKLGEAFGMLEKMKPGEVSSFIRDWRGPQDSNQSVCLEPLLRNKWQE